MEIKEALASPDAAFNSPQCRLSTIMQLSDSGFPTGGFSHSCGYEAAYRLGHVKNVKQMKDFLMGILENTGSQSLPVLRAAYDCSDDLVRVAEVDRFCDVSLNNHVAKKASVQQGKSILSTASETFPQNGIKVLKNAVKEGSLIGHQAVVFGCLCSYLNISLNDTAEIFLFNQLRTVVASTVRLGNIGPLEAQRVQFELQQLIPEIMTRFIDVSLEDSCITFPLVDLFQNCHDTLFSKMFYS